MDQEAVGGRVVGRVDYGIDWNMCVDFAALDQQVSGEASLEMPIDEQVDIENSFTPKKKSLLTENASPVPQMLWSSARKFFCVSLWLK